MHLVSPHHGFAGRTRKDQPFYVFQCLVRAQCRLDIEKPEALRTTRNAFDTHLYGAVADALDEVAAREDLAVAVLTGEGSAYSAGQDLAEMGRLGDPSARAERAEAGAYGFTKFIGTIEAFPKPIVAAVNGVAVGVGTTMLPYCDLVLAASSARFRLPFASLGVVPEAGEAISRDGTRS